MTARIHQRHVYLVRVRVIKGLNLEMAGVEAEMQRAYMVSQAIAFTQCSEQLECALNRSPDISRRVFRTKPQASVLDGSEHRVRLFAGATKVGNRRLVLRIRW